MTLQKPQDFSIAVVGQQWLKSCCITTVYCMWVMWSCGNSSKMFGRAEIISTEHLPMHIVQHSQCDLHNQLCSCDMKDANMHNNDMKHTSTIWIVQLIAQCCPGINPSTLLKAWLYIMPAWTGFWLMWLMCSPLLLQCLYPCSSHVKMKTEIHEFSNLSFITCVAVTPSD